MDGTGIRDEVIQEICEIAEKYKVEKVILFGSRARGDFRRTSDIDLAVKEEILSILLWMWMRRLRLFSCLISWI